MCLSARLAEQKNIGGGCRNVSSDHPLGREGLKPRGVLLVTILPRGDCHNGYVWLTTEKLIVSNRGTPLARLMFLLVGSLAQGNKLKWNNGGWFSYLYRIA